MGAVGELNTSTNSREPEVVRHRQILLAKRFRAIFVFTGTDSRIRKLLSLIGRGKNVVSSYPLILIALRGWSGTMPKWIRIVMRRWLCQISCLASRAFVEYRGNVAFRSQIIAQVILLQMVTAIRGGSAGVAGVVSNLSTESVCRFCTSRDV